jgi:heme b synthase
MTTQHPHSHPGAKPSPHPHGSGKPDGSNLRLVAWETTRSCNLACVHCRAAARLEPYEGELDTQAAYTLLDQIREIGTPIIILTGGEPLLRHDIFDISDYGTKKGLRMVMAPNGTLITQEYAHKMAESGIKRISISIDGATRERHDRFRGVPGAFDGAMQGIAHAKEAQIEFQINTTITKANLAEIPQIMKLAEELGAVAHHIFLLVPTGRGKYIIDQAISAKEYETTLNWFYDQRKKTTLQLKATCAPHYYRIMRQRAKEEGETITFESHGLDAVTRGCLGGTSFCFVSHVGDVQPCGFLHTHCGNVKERSFAEIWKSSKTFIELRDYKQYEGKCGRCEYVRVCGGCRARAFEATGNYLAEEPLCSYEPRGLKSEKGSE